MAKLDALSHFSFTPQPTVEEVSVKADAPALMMEEVAPQVVSAASMKTAAEVFAPSAPGGMVRDAAELSQEERRTLRGKKKRGAKKRVAAKVGLWWLLISIHLVHCVRIVSLGRVQSHTCVAHRRLRARRPPPRRAAAPRWLDGNRTQGGSSRRRLLATSSAWPRLPQSQRSA